MFAANVILVNYAMLQLAYHSPVISADDVRATRERKRKRAAAREQPVSIFKQLTSASSDSFRGQWDQRRRFD